MTTDNRKIEIMYKTHYCINGCLYRHDPQFDDPELMTERGKCPDCSGDGCSDDPEEMVSKAGRRY